MSEIKYCVVCGRPIPFDKYNHTKKRTTCSFDCRMEVKRSRAREYNREHRIREHGTVAAQLKHGVGYGYLAQAIVNTAIEDIRACSKKEIERFENPAYRTRISGRPHKMMNYFDAKAFLLGRRITGITGLDGKGIWDMLMREKGIEI